LRVNFDPDAAWGVDIVAFFHAVRAGWVAHKFLTAANEEKEEHAAPGDDVEAVEDDEEAQGCEGKFPEGFKADFGGFAPGVFGWEFVAGGVDAVFVGALHSVVG